MRFLRAIFTCPWEQVVGHSGADETASGSGASRLWHEGVPAPVYSPIRCFSSQTRSAASRRLFVRVRVPTAGNSFTATAGALLFRGRPRRALVLPALRAVSLMGRWPALFMPGQKAASKPLLYDPLSPCARV